MTMHSLAGVEPLDILELLANATPAQIESLRAELMKSANIPTKATA